MKICWHKYEIAEKFMSEKDGFNFNQYVLQCKKCFWKVKVVRKLPKYLREIKP